MSLPLVPIALGLLGAGALILPKLGGGSSYQPGPAPGPTPDTGYQGIPQTDIDRPSRVPFTHGQRYMTDLRSVELWNGSEDFDQWKERVGQIIEAFLASNGLAFESSYWTNQATMKGGMPMRVNVEFTYQGPTGTHTFAAPRTTGAFVESLANA